jgi:hypothetical protein
MRFVSIYFFGIESVGPKMAKLAKVDITLAREIVGGGEEFRDMTDQTNQFYGAGYVYPNFYKGLYFDPNAAGNKGRYTNAKKIGVVQETAQRTIVLHEFGADGSTDIQNKKPFPMNSDQVAELNVNDYIYISPAKGGSYQKINAGIPKQYSLSFTKTGNVIYPFGIYVNAAWMTPYQTNAGMNSYPSGPHADNWGVFRF